MSVSLQQHQFVSRSVSVADPASIHFLADTVRHHALRDVLVAGRPGASAAETTQAVMTCLQWLRCRSIAQRLELHDAIRAAIAAGRATSRAWLPVAMSEIEPALLRAAVAGYVGCARCDAAHRARATDDAIEWFRRGLTLDRVAVFEALLALRDTAVNARLAGLRGRLTDAEHERVQRHFMTARDPLTREFLDDWRAASAPQAQLD